MHSLFGLAGLLGLVALAFGKAVAARVAQAIIMLAIALVLLIAFDIITGGAISSHI